MRSTQIRPLQERVRRWLSNARLRDKLLLLNVLLVIIPFALISITVNTVFMNQLVSAETQALKQSMNEVSRMIDNFW